MQRRHYEDSDLRTPVLGRRTARSRASASPSQYTVSSSDCGTRSCRTRAEAELKSALRALAQVVSERDAQLARADRKVQVLEARLEASQQRAQISAEKEIAWRQKLAALG